MRIVRGGAWVNDDVSMLRCALPAQGAARHVRVQRGIQDRMRTLMPQRSRAGCTAAAQEPMPLSAPVIVTTGEAVVQRAPDRGVRHDRPSRARAKSPRDAQRQNAEAMTAVVSSGWASCACSEGRRPHARLRPSSRSSTSRRDARVSRGFVARNTVEVRVDDIAQDRRDCSTPRSSAARRRSAASGSTCRSATGCEREALRLAVADARARAEAAAAGAGRSIDRVIKIEDARAGARSADPRR